MEFLCRDCQRVKPILDKPRRSSGVHCIICTAPFRCWRCWNEGKRDKVCISCKISPKCLL